MKTFVRSLALVLILGAAAAARANPIVLDGGFETPVVGAGQAVGFHTGETFGAWYVDSAVYDASVIDKDYNHPSALWPVPPEGRQYLYLGDSLSVSRISQQVSLVAGHNYTFSFWLADLTSHNGLGGGMVQVDIDDGSASLLGGPVVASTGIVTGFYQYSYDFTALATQAYSLSFTSFDGHAANLDDVRITERTSSVPESTPTAMLLLATSASLFALRRRS